MLIDGNALGKALAFLRGDLRDWPAQCGWCGSEDIQREPPRDHLRCAACGKLTTREVAEDARYERARREVGAAV